MNNFFRQLSAVLFLSVFPFANAQSQECDISLRVEDTSKTGTNIRMEPKGTVLFALPQALETFHGLHVVGYKNGWWKLNKVYHELGSTIAIEEAWIHKSVATTGHDDGEMKADGQNGMMLTTPIYAGPTYAKKTGVLMNIKGKIEFIGCSGRWLHIKHQFAGKTTTGWWAPEDQCHNSVTNCLNGSKGEETGVDQEGNR